MPAGKPAGQACVQLDPAGDCRLFGQPSRPAVCVSLQPHASMCGNDRTHALTYLQTLERLTAP